MAHFALLNDDNIVVNVIVVSDEHEANGSEWCNKTFGGRWVQTSIHGRIRKNPAGIGYKYDPIRDAFIPPPNPIFPTWVFNEETCNWEPPIPYPQDGKNYYWDITTHNWEVHQPK